MTAGSPASLRVQSPALTEGRSGTVSGIQPTTKSPPLIHHLKTNALDQAVTFVERESVRHRGLARAERPAWRPLSRPLPQSSAVSGTGGFETDDREGAIERAGVGAPLLVVSSGPGQHCRPLVTLELPGRTGTRLPATVTIASPLASKLSHQSGACSCPKFDANTM